MRLPLHRPLYIALMLCLCCSSAWGQTETAQRHFSSGNAHLGERRYEEALTAYDSAALAGGLGFDLWYNAGVAAYRSGYLGRAAFFWEKARRLRPADEEVRHNLRVAYARSRSGLADPDERPLARLRDLATADGWGLAALALGLLGTSGLIGRAFLSPKRPLQRAAGITGAACMLLAAICLALANAQLQRSKGRYIVVIAPKAVLLAAPDAASTPLDTLPEAAKLPLTDQLGGFYQVALPNGEEPWLEAEKVAVN